MNKFKTTVNGINLAVDADLKDWGISDPASTMIAYLATNSEEKKLFVQWPNGTGNYYSNVPVGVLNSIVKAPSAGKFFHANIKDQYETEKVTSPLINLVPQEEIFGEDIDDDLYNTDDDEGEFFGGI